MANLEEIFDFETAFEKAAQAILTTAGISAFISQQQESLPTVSTGISFDVGSATEARTIVPSGNQEYFKYRGTMTMEVAVARDEAGGDGTSTFLAKIRAKIRVAMMRSKVPFTVTNLPLYIVDDIKPEGTTTGLDAVRNQDLVSLRFAIAFHIRPNAWPAS